MPSIFLRRPSRSSPAQNGLLGFVAFWMPALLGMVVIAIESTPTFSGEHTSHFLRPLFEAIFGHIADPTWDETNHLIRKSGHFIGYGTLCVLFLRAWLWTLAGKTGLSDKAWRLRAWLLALLSNFFVASCDEFHQSFLPSRTGKFSDVLLDTCGGFILTSIAFGIARLVGTED